MNKNDTIHRGRADLLGDEHSARVEQAVAFINETVARSSLEVVQRVGRYVLDEFFDGRYEFFADPSRSKPISFRSLIARDDLLPGGRELYRIVRIAHQLEELPAELATSLSMTHHRTLLCIHDQELKRGLAQRTVENEWTSRELEAEVRARAAPSRAGRKPVPTWRRSLDRAARAFSPAEALQVSGRELDQMTSEQIAELHDQLETTKARLLWLEAQILDAIEDQ